MDARPAELDKNIHLNLYRKGKSLGEVQKMCRDGVSPSMPGPDYSSQLEIDGRVVCEYIVKESKRKNTTRQQYASAYRKSKTPQRALFLCFIIMRSQESNIASPYHPIFFLSVNAVQALIHVNGFLKVIF